MAREAGYRLSAGERAVAVAGNVGRVLKAVGAPETGTTGAEVTSAHLPDSDDSEAFPRRAVCLSGAQSRFGNSLHRAPLDDHVRRVRLSDGQAPRPGRYRFRHVPPLSRAA